MLLKRTLLSLLLCLPFAGGAQKRSSSLPVHVTVTVRDETADKNMILYKKDRPLAIADFKGKPDMASHGVGATYSGILMEMEGQEKNGKLEVKVYLTVYYDRSKSWMKKEGKNERVLAHEQRHFDLTAIKACDLARAISEAKFTGDDVRTVIRGLQQLHTTQLNELQRQYDAQTIHGTVPDQQQAWNDRIDKGLAGSSCI